MGGAAKEAQAAVERGDMKRVEAIIQSMTVAERRDPELLNGPRKRRVARGSGTSLQDVNRLLKQFAEMKKLMRQLGGAGRRGMLPFGPRR
jgi:signal recognition particle subunit SRP54